MTNIHVKMEYMIEEELIITHYIRSVFWVASGLHQAESLHDEAQNLQQHSWWELWPVPLLTQLSQRVIGQTEELGRPADLPFLLQGEGQ